MPVINKTACKECRLKDICKHRHEEIRIDTTLPEIINIEIRCTMFQSSKGKKVEV